MESVPPILKWPLTNGMIIKNPTQVSWRILCTTKLRVIFQDWCRFWFLAANHFLVLDFEWFWAILQLGNILSCWHHLTWSKGAQPISGGIIQASGQHSSCRFFWCRSSGLCSKYQWLPMATNGYQWLPMATNGYQWLPITTAPVDRWFIPWFLGFNHPFGGAGFRNHPPNALGGRCSSYRISICHDRSPCKLGQWDDPDTMLHFAVALSIPPLKIHSGAPVR